MAATKKDDKKNGKEMIWNEYFKLSAFQSMNKTRGNWIQTVKDYNEKYVTKPFEKGMEFMTGFQKDPQKAFEGLMDDGKKFTQDVRKDPRKVFGDMVDDGKDFVLGVRKDIQKAFDNVTDGSKDLYKALEKDRRKLLDDLADSRKKLMNWIPGMSALQEGITKGFETVPGLLNLPSKNDLDDLAKSVKTLNNRLNTLTKQYSS